MADIAATYDLVDEATVGGEVVEVVRASHQQGVIDRPLEVSVRSFDGTVLVSDAGIVASGCHAVVGHEVLVATRQVGAGIPVQVAECRRQTVAAVLSRHPAERPERVLQAFGEGDEALAAKHDMGMFEAGIGEPEVIEPMIERLTRDGDAGAAHVGEVRQAEPAWLMRLPEDDLLFLAVNGPPGPDTAFDGAANAGTEFGMTPQHLLEDCDRPDARRRLQQRHDLGVENVGERVGAAALARNLPLRGQPRILLDAIGRGRADRRLRRRDGRRVGLPELHEKPHLVIGYVAAGHKVIPPIGKTTGIPGRPRSQDDALKGSPPTS